MSGFADLESSVKRPGPLLSDQPAVICYTQANLLPTLMSVIEKQIELPLIIIDENSSFDQRTKSEHSQTLHNIRVVRFTCADPQGE